MYFIDFAGHFLFPIESTLFITGEFETRYFNNIITAISTFGAAILSSIARWLCLPETWSSIISDFQETRRIENCSENVHIYSSHHLCLYIHSRISDINHKIVLQTKIYSEATSRRSFSFRNFILSTERTFFWPGQWLFSVAEKIRFFDHTAHETMLNSNCACSRSWYSVPPT